MVYFLAGSVLAVSSVFLSPLLFWSSVLLWFFLYWCGRFFLGSFVLLRLFSRALSLRSPFSLPLGFCCFFSSFRCILLLCLYPCGLLPSPSPLLLFFLVFSLYSSFLPLPFYSSPTLFGSPSVFSCCSFLLSVFSVYMSPLSLPVLLPFVSVFAYLGFLLLFYLPVSFSSSVLSAVLSAVLSSMLSAVLSAVLSHILSLFLFIVWFHVMVVFPVPCSVLCPILCHVLSTVLFIFYLLCSILFYLLTHLPFYLLFHLFFSLPFYPLPLRRSTLSFLFSSRGPCFVSIHVDAGRP